MCIRGPKVTLLITPQIYSTLQFTQGSASFISVDSLPTPVMGKELSRSTLFLEAGFRLGLRSPGFSPKERDPQVLFISQYLSLFSKTQFSICAMRGHS